MSNKRKVKTRQTRRIAPTSPIGKIAAATNEQADDVEAAIVTLMAAGYTFDQVWDALGALPADGGKVVDMAAEMLAALDD